MSEGAPALGFDVGGQSAKGVLVSPQGAVLSSASVATGEATTPDLLADSLAGLLETLDRDHILSREAPAGVGIAGALDRSGTVRGSPHLPHLVGCRLGQLLSARLGRRVVMHNDADCAAMAEGWAGGAAGAAADCDDFLMIALGTGVGSGLVLGGMIRAGASGYGCEFGHTMVVYGGRRCGCGNRGCLEAYISETAARGLVAEAAPALRDRVAHRIRSEGGAFAEAVFELGASGDAEAEQIAGRMVDVLGAALGSAVNVLDLTTIVIGGGLAPGVLSRLPRLRSAAEATLFARPVSELNIVAAARGRLAGAIGAARLGMLAH